ncbi:putative DNA-binding protein [Mycobacteroides abscessus subsp. abscessus]|nr:putative DNA-binding protein [Mycobacteroides abscessus subsp. abscessus]
MRRAAETAGRDPGEIQLLPVTKFFPASDVEELYRLGCREFGESRDQEAAAKVALLDQAGHADIRWHMVGNLQRNKAKSVAHWAHSVHSGWAVASSGNPATRKRRRRWLCWVRPGTSISVGTW